MELQFESIPLSNKLQEGYNNTMTVENEKTYRVFLINAIHDSRELVIYKKTSPISF